MPWPSLNERAQQLLKVLVERYINDGVPVGSRTLSRALTTPLSPATIRNVMADLEELGLICAPHTSAGRVPTELGYRFFVDQLLVHRDQGPDGREIGWRLRQEAEVGGAQAVAETASNLLSGLTRYAGVVSVTRQVRHNLRQIDFIPLSGRRVLAILVTQDGQVLNRVLEVGRDYGADELTRHANYLNERLRGIDLRRLREHLFVELKSARETLAQGLEEAISLADQALREGEDAPALIVAGQSNLLGLDDLPSMEGLKRLFEAFNEKRELLSLLDHCERGQGVQIFIGRESGSPTFEECSVIGAPYTVDGEVVGVLGVIGPKRMAYDRVIQIVDITARLMGSALNSR
ncbi:MAG: heat-inducible transcriptional repressor HrcA [Halothiobacillaceae bacterium]|jgi:heat-inducible transcriptional repressor|nr:heat-inducible transcriptional repressor HrcA [Halothiobacillaceae bacterium]MDY0049382.1 heat-inducible transcriptional repressor HrcA [Halothiobacillaceae bacterium]